MKDGLLQKNMTCHCNSSFYEVVLSSATAAAIITQYTDKRVNNEMQEAVKVLFSHLKATFYD